ncbi:MAG: hypothetical protein HOC70_06860 [Gammaproteobacteria bacterium]|mgnify:FL=1|jgi:hypothetical protein|nr:hypothetical protein [Gammaproteobacteria bacterium]MBT4492947.1 hypothetical protein [Gammaproteobacteria bacterium]MBT7372075.1 hypothetical protein [Gammaproteobacteria bacterium]
MASSFWLAVSIICVTGLVTNGIVQIVRVARSGGGKLADRAADLDEQMHDLRAEIEEARQRIEVLEKIVTDQKFDLGRQIDDLASGT